MPGEGKVTMNLNGTKYTYNFFRVSKHPTTFPPEKEVEEVDSLCFVETLRDPLQTAMENQISNQQDEELEEATKGLGPHDGSVEEEKFEDIGEIKPEEPQVLEVVTEPLKLLPHYRLDPSSGSLSNNTEVTRHLCRVVPGKSLTSQDRHLYNKLTRRRV
jgi:hypothetical protein